jgi:Rps23 Pro-64 3,4-dihydroxylase Tpa1-like proline 4-hydroxylase
MDRVSLGNAIAGRLQSKIATVQAEFDQPGQVPTSILDNVLEPSTCSAIHAAFPDPATMMERRTIRERKYVAAQMDRYDPLLEEAVYAFQQPRVVEALSQITGISDLVPDERLYAGGVSLMGRDNFLNPHIDNSHNDDRTGYRVLNLLYYVTPDWEESYGGSLQLWDRGLRQPSRTIESRFNRLVVMGTTPRSWHSVTPIVHEGSRCCVSNYYFAPRPLASGTGYAGQEYFHVTKFRGFPEERLKDVVLRGDATLRTAVRKVRRQGLVATRHIYRNQ